MKRLLLALAVLAGFSALVGSAAASSAATAVKAPKAHAASKLTLIVKSDSEHAKKGPDGKWHDAFLPADFSLKAGAKTTVTIVNYDNGTHSLVSPSLGLDVAVPAAKGKTPGRVTFTVDPKKAGRYDWWCGGPCDPWAMTHNGYMRGFIDVTA